MKSLRNDALYQRHERLGLFSNLGGMALLVAAVFVLFNTPGRLGTYFLFLLGGIAMVQAGLYFGRQNRRPDLKLDEALKSLDNSYSIYHHLSPAQHLLAGPSGAWILIPRHTKGKIHFNKEKQSWQNRSANPLRRIWRWITGERLGRPHYEAMIEAGSLDRFLQKEWNSGEDVAVHAAVVFLDEDVELDVGEAPFPAVNLKKLKQTVTKNPDGKAMSKAALNRLNKILGS